MKRAHPPSSPSHFTPRTPKRIKLTHPQDSPTNPFSPPKPASAIRALPPISSFSKHLPLRFQFKGTRTFRVVQVPCNYTFVHLRALIAWLFRDVLNDPAPALASSSSRRTSTRLSTRRNPSTSKPKTRSRVRKRLVPSHRLVLAASAGDDGPTFKVLKDVSIHEPGPKTHMNEYIIIDGKVIAKLSPVHDPFHTIFTPPASSTSPSNTTPCKAGPSALLLDSEEGGSPSFEMDPSLTHLTTLPLPGVYEDPEEVYVGAGDWVWEPSQEFTVGNAWPQGADIKRGIVYHHNRRQEIHITLNTLQVTKKRSGRGNEPYVFIAKGTRSIAPTSSEEDYPEDSEEEEMRLGWGMGGALEPEPRAVDLRYWNPPEGGQRMFRKGILFHEFFKNYERDPEKDADGEDDENPKPNPQIQIKPLRLSTPPLPQPPPPPAKKKLVFPNMRATKIDALNLRVVSERPPPPPRITTSSSSSPDRGVHFTSPILPPDTSSPVSEFNPGLSSSFGSSPGVSGALLDLDTPRDDDDEDDDDDDAVCEGGGGEEDWLAPRTMGELGRDDEDEDDTAVLSSPKKRRRRYSTPCHTLSRSLFSSSTSPPSPSSSHTSLSLSLSHSSPSSPHKSHRTRTRPSLPLLPTYPLNGPTPYPASKLIRTRVDHWATRRLGRLCKRGLKNGVFDVLDVGVGDESLFEDGRDEGEELDELDGGVGGEAVKKLELPVLASRSQSKKALAATSSTPAVTAKSAKGTTTTTTGTVKSHNLKAEVDLEDKDGDVEPDVEVDELDASDSEENQYVWCGMEVRRAESVEV